MNKILALALAGTLSAASASAQVPADITIERTSTPPNIDGVLDDEVWSKLAPLPAGEWTSYNPVRGDRM
ncbi:MAG TPA: hypothetical protein VEA16_22415, partial [Vicinamibacterales bacterium]|nr:hypothetical protein [Vicinamibacterales bacterium]